MPAITRGLVNAPPAVPEGRNKLRVYDDRLTGFFMEVWPSGIVTFWVRYRNARGKTREWKVGRLGDITVDQARKAAQETRAQVALGGDPAAEREALRAVPTLSEFVEGRYLPYAKERLRSFRDQESFWRLRVKRWWGARALDEVRPHDVAELQDRLRREGLSNATVNRYVAFVRRVFALALRWRAMAGDNPAAHAEMRRETQRDRFLSEDELRALFRALEQEANRGAALAIALLAATGARRSEVLKARWEHVDWDRRLLTAPLSKSGRRRHIPLSDAALTILRSQRDRAVGEWVFPGEDPAKPVVRRAQGLAQGEGEGGAGRGTAAPRPAPHLRLDPGGQGGQPAGGSNPPWAQPDHHDRPLRPSRPGEADRGGQPSHPQPGPDLGGLTAAANHTTDPAEWPRGASRPGPFCFLETAPMTIARIPTGPRQPTLPSVEALEAAAAQLATGRLLAPKDVAAMLGVGIRTLERWRGSGEGPAFMAISRATIRYTERAVAEFVASRTRSNTAQALKAVRNGA